MDRLREPLPTRVEDTPELPAAYAAALEAGLDALALTLSPDGAGGDRRSRPPAAGLDRGDQPDRDPRAGRGRHSPRRRQPEWRRASCASEASTGSSTWGRAAATRASRSPRPCPAARALLLEPVAKKAGFLSAVASATGLGGHRRGGAGPGRGTGRRSPPSRSLAGGDRPGRGRPRRARRARVPAARTGWRARRLEARRHRRASWPPRNGRSTRSAAGRSRSVPSPSTASTATDWSSSPRAAAVPAGYPRDPGCAQAAAMVSGTLLDWTACESSCSPTSTATCSPSMPSSRRSVPSMRSGISATSSATGRSRMAWSTA